MLQSNKINRFLLPTLLLIISNPILADSNIALGKPTTASSYFNSETEVFPPEKVVDGITTDTGSPSDWSFWLSAPETNGGQWVQVDLGQNYPIGKIVLYDTHNRAAYDRGTKDFHLSLSPDNTNFQNIGVGTFTEDQWRNQTPIEVSPINAVGRYLRFNVLRFP